MRSLRRCLAMAILRVAPLVWKRRSSSSSWIISPKYGLASGPSTAIDVIAQAGTRLPRIVHRYLEHEKAWLQLQADLMHFVALLSQLATPEREGVQKFKGK